VARTTVRRLPPHLIQAIGHNSATNGDDGGAGPRHKIEPGASSLQHAGGPVAAHRDRSVRRPIPAGDTRGYRGPIL